MFDSAKVPDAVPGNDPKVAAMGKETFADRYEVSRRTCDYWIARGMPILKLSPRQVRIPLVDADEWVRKQFFTQRRAA